jgi:hypothetical protein
MLKFSTLRRAITGATVTAGLLAAAAPAVAAPVMFSTPGSGGARLEGGYTLTEDVGGAYQVCTPAAMTTSTLTHPNFGTPPTVAFHTWSHAYSASCWPSGSAKLSLKAPMLGSVNAGVYTFTGPGFNLSGTIANNPSAPAVPPVVGTWTNPAAPDGLSRLKFDNVLIGYDDPAGQNGVRLTATFVYGSAALAPRP